MRKMKSNKRGKESDEMLLNIVRAYPGLSQYEILRKLRWSSGHVDGAIRRLLRSNKVFLEVVEREGRRVNLVYPEEKKPSNFIEVPSELLEVGNPSWSDQAFFYALDSSTIGVSGSQMSEWEELSCFVETIPIRRDGEKVLFNIPENFWRFYNLDKRHRVISVNGNAILVTVSGYIIKEKAYPR